jgi:16S rRNA (uracil1498-N3)-methyltransferase
MPQARVRPEDIRGDSFSLHGDQAKHLLRVLRLRENDPVTLFDGAGRRYRAVINAADVAGNRVDGRIVEAIAVNAAGPRLRLFQGLPRGAKFDYVLEKATELGAEEIIPFTSEKNLIKISELSPSKIDRWSRVVEAAAKQCNRSTLPAIHPAVDLPSLSPFLRDGTSFVFWEREQTASFRSALRKHSPPAVLNLIVGPEAGFTEKEVELLSSWGAIPVSLGPRVLRSETAPLVALALAAYETGAFEVGGESAS